MTNEKKNPLSNSTLSESSNDEWVERNLQASKQHEFEPVLVDWHANEEVPNQTELIEDFYDSEADLSDEEWVAKSFKGKIFNKLSCSGCFTGVAYNCTITRKIGDRVVYIAKQAPRCCIQMNSVSKELAQKRLKLPSTNTTTLDHEMVSLENLSEKEETSSLTHSTLKKPTSFIVTCQYCSSSIGFYNTENKEYLLYDVLLSLFG